MPSSSIILPNMTQVFRWYLNLLFFALSCWKRAEVFFLLDSKFLSNFKFFKHYFFFLRHSSVLYVFFKLVDFHGWHKLFKILFFYSFNWWPFLFVKLYEVFILLFQIYFFIMLFDVYLSQCMKQELFFSWI